MQTDSDSLEGAALDILEYLAAGRDLIMEGDAVLQRVCEGERPRSSARTVFDGVRREIKRAQWFARSEPYTPCAESLLGLADDLEALRDRARRLL